MFDHKISTNEHSWFGIAIIVFVIGAVLYLLFNMAYPDTSAHEIKSIELVNNVQGSDGDTWTTVYYVVVTDKGIYHLKTTGINSAPDLASKIEPGKKCTLTTRGIHSNFFGFYKSIVDVF